MKYNNSTSTNNSHNSVVIYGRLSVTSFDGENESVDRQIALGRKFAEYQELTVEGIFSEISSGRNDNRQEFEKAVKLAKKTKSVLWVYSLSRLSRKVIKTLQTVEELEKAGAALYSHSEKLSSDSNGKMLLTIMAAFNAKEVDEIRARTKFAMSAKRKENKVISTFIPYGYKKSKCGTKLVEIPRQQKIIERMEYLRNVEKLSFQKIADKIKETIGWRPKYDDLAFIIKTAYEWEKGETLSSWIKKK